MGSSRRSIIVLQNPYPYQRCEYITLHGNYDKTILFFLLTFGIYLKCELCLSRDRKLLSSCLSINKFVITHHTIWTRYPSRVFTVCRPSYKWREHLLRALVVCVNLRLVIHQDRYMDSFINRLYSEDKYDC